MVARTRLTEPYVCALFCALGFLGNWFNLKTFFDVNFLLGSFFVMLAIRCIGGVCGVVVAFVASVCTYLIWNHPWSIIVFTCEAVFVAGLFSRRKGNLVIYDIIYWIFIGMPMSYFFFNVVMGMQADGSFLLSLMQALNGVFNALTAMLAYILFRFWKHPAGGRIPYSQLIFIVMASLFVLPSTFLFITGLHTYQENGTKQLESRVAYVSRTLQKSLGAWVEEHQKNIQALSDLTGDPEKSSFEEMQHNVEAMKLSFPAFKMVCVLDRNSTTVAFSPLEERGKSTLGIDLSDRPYIPIIERDKKPLIMELDAGRIGNESPLVVIVAPIIVSGEYKGCCAGALETSAISDILANGADRGIQIAVTGGAGKVIASTLPSLKVMDGFPPPYARSEEVLNRTVSWIPAVKSGRDFMQRWMDSRMVRAAPIGANCDWKVFVEGSYLPLMEEMSAFGIARLRVLSILILFSLVLSHFLSKGFISTIVYLQALTKSLPARLTHNTRIDWPQSGVEELAALSDNFREMTSALMQDISEREAAEQALRVSEAKFRSYMESAPIAIFAADKRGRLVEFNQALAALLGYDPLTMQNMRVTDLHPPDILDQVASDFESLLRMGHVEVERRMKKADGQLICVSLKAVMIGNRFSLGYCLDVTELKHAERALRESEERFRTIFEQAAVGVAQVYYRDGRFVKINRKFCDIVGYSTEEMLEKSLKDITHPDHIDSDSEMVAKLLSGEIGTYSIEKRFIHRDGSTVWVNLWVSPMHAGDLESDFHIAIAEDITERKRLEDERSLVEVQLRQAQKMESLGTLAGGIAHDFNNILAIIVGYAEMVYSDLPEDAGDRRRLGQVLKAAERAKDLVNQILAFSRQNDKEHQPVQAGPIVKEAMRMLRATLPSTITLKVNVTSRAVVLADPTQIHQILMNLCTNAAHAMQEKGGTLEVVLTDAVLTPQDMPSYPDLQPGHHAQLTVRDSGHGINPAILDRIFDPFFTTKKKGVGTGLGLSVVHGIVKSHGGNITVSSIPDAGTTFCVLLPTIEETPPEAEMDPALLPGGRERVLVVDDEPDLAEAVSLMLQRLGYRVDSRTDPLEALTLFGQQPQRQRFDLVITDMTMPHLTGTDLAKELFRLDPNLAVILCTGFSENADEARARRVGIRGFLMKPVILRDLAGTVRKVLDERTKSRAS